MGAENDSDTTVNFSEDQDFHSFGKSPKADLKQKYMSPAPTNTTEDKDIGESSEVEEMLTHYYVEERDVDGDQQAAMVAVIDKHDVTEDGHEEADDMAQTEMSESNELDSIEKQLESMGEGSPSSRTLNKEPEAVGGRSPVESTLDDNSNRYL